MISSQKHTSDTTELAETKHHKFHVKDPGSCFTKRLEKQIRAILRRWLCLSSA